MRLRPPLPEAHGPERVAFTLQAVESRRLNGSPRLELNVIGRVSDQSIALDALAGPHQMRILNIIVSARRRVSSLGPSRQSRKGRAPSRLCQEVPTKITELMQDLARSLEKAGRQRGKRTAHAEGRRIDNRPISKAQEDALAAPDDFILWDGSQRTVVVIGPRNRIHIFNPEGRHITSFILGADAIQSRVQRKRWLKLRGDKLERFNHAAGRLFQKGLQGTRMKET